MIAISLTNLAIDTALRKNPSEYPVPVYLIGMKKEWIFSQPFDTRPIAVTGEGWKVEIPATSEASVAALKLLLEKLGDKSSAETNSIS